MPVTISHTSRLCELQLPSLGTLGLVMLQEQLHIFIRTDKRDFIINLEMVTSHIITLFYEICK